MSFSLESLARVKLPSLSEVEAELYARSFRRFVRSAWAHVEPGTPFTDGWHIGAIAEHLEAVSKGQIRRIIINIPPRHMKSNLISVMWPAWDWINRPSRRFFTSSYAIELSRRDAVRSRHLIQSPWYQERWADRFQLTKDQNEKTRYENDHRGYRIATSVAGGSATGEGGDILVIDDPHKAHEVESDTRREGAIEWWRGTWSTRLNDPKSSCEVIIMQRLHERDLTGYVLAEIGDYEHLMLPARYEPDRKSSTSIGWSDPRTTEGELLWSDRYTSDELAGIEAKLGSYGAAGQMQQRPSPAGGGKFKAWWLRYWYPRGLVTPPKPELVRKPDGEWFECPQIERPENLYGYAQSWDCAFKGAEDSDSVCGQVWASLGADSFLLDSMTDKMDIIATMAAIRLLSKRWPQALEKLIEDKANGTAVVTMLTREIPGLIPIEPDGGKVVRATAVVPVFEAGNVYLPHPDYAPWVRAFVAELTTFPGAAHDDQVDACTQYLNRRYKDANDTSALAALGGRLQ